MTIYELIKFLSSSAVNVNIIIKFLFINGNVALIIPIFFSLNFIRKYWNSGGDDEKLYRIISAQFISFSLLCIVLLIHEISASLFEGISLLKWMIIFIMDDWIIISAYIIRLKGYIENGHKLRILGFNYALLCLFPLSVFALPFGSYWLLLIIAVVCGAFQILTFAGLYFTLLGGSSSEDTSYPTHVLGHFLLTLIFLILLMVSIPIISIIFSFIWA